MDVRFINPFLAAVGLVFRTAADMSVYPGKPRVKTADEGHDRVYTVSATIELKGGVSGLVSMRFSMPVVIALVRALTGEIPREVDANCLDALGEVANMVVGNAKKDFPIGDISISTPRVGSGDALEDPPVLVMPFECSSGRFVIEARLKTPPPPATAPPVHEPKREQPGVSLPQEKAA